MSLTNSQYDELMREYSRRQLADARNQQACRQEAYEKIPQLRELDEQIGSSGVAFARRIISGEISDASAFRKNADEIRIRRSALLRDAGYPEDYLDMHYTCSDCKDTGYVNGKRCHCFTSAAIDLFYTQSGLRDALETENFSHFSFRYYPEDLISEATDLNARENMVHIVSDCRDFIEHFDEKPENLLFYGKTGLGKTFLSHCIARELLDTAHSVLYYSAPALFDELADIRFGRKADENGDHSHYYESDFLIIDDLGTELTNSFSASQLFLILNERIARHKSTLISTNLELRDLAENYSERVFSRITSSFRLYEFFGNDIRVQTRFRGDL